MIIEKDEVRTIQINILKHLVSFFELHSLKYYLAYGTFLGAIRHGGYIPWDDDIDIMMPRKDYELFLKLFDNKGRYKVFNYKTNKLYNLPLTKVCDTNTTLIQSYGFNEKAKLGINIDVFVIDDLPYLNPQKNIKIFRHASFLRKCWKLSIYKYGFKTVKDSFLQLVSIPFKIMGSRYFVRRYDEFCYKCSRSSESLYSGVILFGEGLKKELFQKKFFEVETKYLFEKEIFNGVKDYDTYLTQLYGDYMTLPPLENRKEHLFEAYWNEKK